KETDISVTKEWDDSENQDGIRSKSIEVQLLANGEPTKETTLWEGNEWEHIWQGLDAYQSNGQKIDYTVQEVEVPEGYESTIKVEDDGSIIISNTHTPETIEFAVSKVWEDENNQDGVRPDNVTVNLLNGSEIVDEAVLNE